MPVSSRRAAQRKAFVEGRWRKPPLGILQIVAWADEHYEQTGRWPILTDGRVRGKHDETWTRIDNALRHGFRGLPGGDSLARVLARYRGVRNRKALPRLSVEEILAWADAYDARHQRWPTAESGPIEDAPGETWGGVDAALWQGLRGLPSGSSLARLLAEQRDVRNVHAPPLLSIEQILAWGDAHFACTRSWPTGKSGPVTEAPAETWTAIDLALHRGSRGLKGKSSLARLWHKYRGRRKRAHGRTLSEEEILAWADAYQVQHGCWPNPRSGEVAEAPGLNWMAVNTALRNGGRGLAGGTSLPQLLLQHRGVRSQGCAPPLTIAQVLYWADAHRFHHGRWPTMKSGSVEAAPEETWNGINMALVHGYRGLPGDLSLARFLDRHRRRKPK